MAEIWGMVGAAAIGLAGGAMSGRASQKGQEAQNKADKETVKLQGVEQRKTTAYEAELLDYYNQLNKNRNLTARGSMYDKYSKVPKPADYVRAPLMGAKPVNPDGTTTVPRTTANPASRFDQQLAAPTPRP